MHRFAALRATTAWLALLATPAAGAAELLGVRINGIDQAESIVAQRLTADALAVPAEALVRWQLLRPPAGGALRIDGREHIALDAVPGLRWQIDGASQTLVIEVPPAAFARHRFEHAGASRPAPTTAGIGGYANYDLHWQRDSAAASVAGGLVDLGAFGPWGHGRTSGVWRSGSGPYAGTRFTRLDSQWTLDLPARLSSVRVGDAIGAAGAWGRSVRFGGVQWATDFALQPGPVSFPLPALRGEASVPSVVDLYVNDSHRLHAPVPPGPFDMPEVPVVTGQGQIRMVVRDLLGREQVIVQPYYVSPALLRAGLRDFALEAGTVREDFGLASFDYGRAFVAATDRIGVSDTFTREWRAELLRRQQTLGVSGTWLLRQLATATASAAVSRGPQGFGALLAGGIDHRGIDWSASVQGRVASREFVQLGQATRYGPAVRAMVSAALATSLGRGSASLNVVHQTDWQGERYGSVALHYGRQLGVLGHLSVFVSHARGASSSTSVGVNLIQMLGGATSASVGSIHSRERVAGAGTRDDFQSVVQVQGNAPVGPGWGYRLQAEHGSADRGIGEATWNTEVASLSVGVARLGSAGPAWRAGASGALAWMPEGVFASRRIDGSFAVVKVGDYPGVRVTRDSQFVGRTDANGHAFVTGLRGFETNRLGVEVANLPLDAQVGAVQIEVSPGRGSGVSVHFPVQRSRSATLRLVTADGTVVPPGSRVRVDGAAREFPVGFDGRLFLADLADRNTLVADWGAARCTASVALGDAPGPVPELGAIACR